MNQRPLWPIIVAALLLVGIAAAVAFNVGVHRGIEQSATLEPPQGGAHAHPYPYYGWHPWGFGFVFAPLFFVFLSVLLIRGLFWRGGWHRHGCGPYDSEEWHRRMHERMDNRSA